jgi:osmoprotectant transport system substrate-binding protein
MSGKRLLSWIFIVGLFIPVLSACGGAATATVAPAAATTRPSSAPSGAAAASGAPGTATRGATATTGAAATAARASATAAVLTGSGTINVGAKDFAEEYIVGNMYKLLLEDAGYTVNLKTDLPTPAAQAAMEAKQLDLYPEYTGTGLVTVLKLPAQSDPKAVFDAVSKGYKDKYNFVWLTPAPMNNTQAFAMLPDKANSLGIKTLSDMAAKAGQLVMVGPAECPEREDCLKGLIAAYGNFKLKEYKAVDAGLRYQAITSGQADVVVAYGTDGELAQYKMVVLQDDKGFFPNYALAPVVRQEVLDKNPQIAAILNRLAPLLTNETMQRLNNEVTGNKQEPTAVARQFLRDQGLIKK